MTTDFVVLTGPISGTVTLPDGREIDVTGAAIYVDDQETADAVAAAIGQHSHCPERRPGTPSPPDL